MPLIEKLKREITMDNQKKTRREKLPHSRLSLEAILLPNDEEYQMLDSLRGEWSRSAFIGKMIRSQFRKQQKTT